jgi:hypothetical protein
MFCTWEMVLHFKWLKKNQKITFHDTFQLYEILILVPINKVLLEHSHAHLFVFTLLQRSWVFVTETIWLTEPIFTIWPFTETIFPTLNRTIAKVTFYKKISLRIIFCKFFLWYQGDLLLVFCLILIALGIKNLKFYIGTTSSGPSPPLQPSLICLNISSS